MGPCFSRLNTTISGYAGRVDTGLALAALLILFAAQALLQPGLPTSADLAIHLHRTLEFERAWEGGVIVPRWSPNLAFGYGYPLFVFAPPLPYLLALSFQQIGLSLEWSFKLLLILTLGLYATGMYLLVRDLFRSSAAGLVAALAYAFAPFALREALLSGGNLPQLLAIGLFPWPLWAVTRAAQATSWRWMALAGCFYAAIMLSHLFQVLVFTPALGLYGLLHLATRRNQAASPRLWLATLGAIPLGLLLSAFFWIPAFTERYATRAQADIYLEKSPFFVRYPYWPELVAWIYPLDSRAANPYTPLSLGVVTLILAGLGLLAAGLCLWRLARRAQPQSGAIPDEEAACPTGVVPAIVFFALVAGGAVGMTLPLSRPVWETVAILQVAEFPWRMLGLANLGLAVLAGAALLLVQPPRRWPVAAACLLLQLLAIAPLLYPTTAFTRYGDVRLSDQLRYEQSSQSVGTTTLGEYLPRTVSRPPTSSPLVEAFQADQAPERLDRESLPPAATATLLEQTAVTHRYQIETPLPFTLRLFQFDYPGWRATLDGGPVEITPEADTGLIRVDIPAGRHEVVIQFGETPGRRLATGVSALTLVGLIALALMGSNQFATGPLSVTSDRLRPNSALGLGLVVFIVVGALGLKPLLRPVFIQTSPREQVLPAHYQADVRFDNGIRLIGYDLGQRVIRPGRTIQVVLYWQTDDSAAISRLNLQPFVHLDRLDNFTTVADSTNYTPGDVTTETNLPTFHWDNERYIRDEHDLTIPSGTAPLAYAVRVGMIDPEQGDRRIPLAGGAGDTAWIDTVNIQPVQAPPSLDNALAVTFSQGQDALHLTGFQITSLTAERLAFTLAWQVETRPAGDYTVFAQLLDSQGNLVAGFDRPPLDGAYPTATWLPGQTIHDSRHIPLTEVPSGTYRLVVGLYEATSGRRLTTTAGNDIAELAPVTIKELAP